MSESVLLHSMPGRCRLRVYGTRFDGELRDRMAQRLRAHPLVSGFRFNPACESVVVTHRGDVLEVIALLEGVKRGAADAERVAPVADERETRADREAAPVSDGMSRSYFAWACGALVLSPLPGWRAIALVPLLVSGVPIWRRALRRLIGERRLNVDFLDGLALAVAMLRGQWATGALMVWMVHLGDLIRDRTALHSRRQIRALVDFQGTSARRVEADGSVTLVTAQDLQPEQMALVLAGDLVPADGVVDSGVASVDQRHMTGESVPSTRRPGDRVYAGSSLVEGSVTMCVTEAGQDTAAARIVHMLEAAPIGETRIQNYAEKFGDRLVAPLLGVNVAMLAATGNVDRFLSMAIIDYGTGIRVAAPTSVLTSMLRAAREGILIKSGRYVEQLAHLHGVAFDKTGTLTCGQLVILDVQSFSAALSPTQVLRAAAAVEAPLKHPVARALVRHAVQQHGLDLPRCEDLDYTVGLGVCARVGTQCVRVGSERYLRAAGIALHRANGELLGFERNGHASLLVAVDESLAGAIFYDDELRTEAPAVVGALKKRNVRDIVMLTGDRHRIARNVAHSVGIRRFFAEVLPGEKAAIMRDLRRDGGPFAMVGDGVNDSPALAQADVGIALNDGADIARNAADVVLMEHGLARLIDAIDLSRDALSLVRQNYAMIAGFNTLALALAVPTGLVSPAVSTLLSNGSALAATLNAMRPLLALPRP